VSNVPAVPAQEASPRGRDKGRPGDIEDVAGLTATLAALQPARAAWRTDILVSAIVEILTRKGGYLSAKEIRTQLQTLWIGKSTDPAAVLHALKTAEQSDLVHMSARASGEPRWAATAEAKEEVQTFQRRAERLLKDFQAEVGKRLEGLLDEPLSRATLGQLTRTLVKAMVAASDRVFEAVKASGNPNDLREVRYNLKGVGDRLRAQVHPLQRADALILLAAQAASPDDDFGDEVLKLIVSGQVLHGLVSRRDMPPGGALNGTALVLDNSFLVMSLEPDKAPRALFDQLLRDSVAAGCRFVVHREVLNEWERMWATADLGEPDALVKRVPEMLARAADSPVLRAYASEHEESGIKWKPFCAKYRNIEQRLVDAGAMVEESLPDAGVAGRVKAELLRVTAAHPELRGRSELSATVDAASASTVAALRKAGPLASGLPSAWFVARDRATPRAYASVINDDANSLDVAPETWLLFLSSAAGNETPGPELVETISENAVLDAFLVVATGYSAENLLEMAGTFPAADIDRAMLTEVLRSRLQPSPDEARDPEREALTIMRRRATALNRTAEAERRAVEQEREAARLAREAESARADAAEARLAALPSPAPAPVSAHVPAAENPDVRKANRRAVGVGIFLTAVLAIVVAGFTFGWTSYGVLAGYFFVAWLAVEAWRFTDDTASAKKFWAAGLSTATVLVGGTWLGSITDDYKADRKARQEREQREVPGTPSPSPSGRAPAESPAEPPADPPATS
jgi:hypothetical protein